MAVSVVSFSTVIWSYHTMALSPTGNRGHCVMRPNNRVKETTVSMAPMNFYICLEVVRQ